MPVPQIELRDPYTTLPRGGYLVQTSAGYVQFGSPPETIKDTMFLPRSAPQIFVLPNTFFHVNKGISVAELEFPIYYNHFLRKKKTYIVCSHEQRNQLLVVLQESVFGPAEVDLRSEYVNGEQSFGFPDIRKEIAHFRGDRKLEDLVRFVIFKDGKVDINSVTIFQDQSEFRIVDRAWEKETAVPADIGFNIIFDTGERLPEPYQPPLLAITCLGPSHGFDPEENTSGFILWINHKGIMVDPPVNSTEWLRKSNVNPKYIHSIILTHCHADHDAGTFQKILEEGRITIYSTETVMDSFIRKYHALTRIPVRELFSLFDFVPVMIGRSYVINDAEFSFSYALHSIPSLSFQFIYKDQSFVYSSDHLNDPEKFLELYRKGVLTKTRLRDLMEFPWQNKIIYHEAGIPPLHTRIDFLSSLPEDIQKRITVYHIARKDMPAGSLLTLARFGMENTLNVPIQPLRYEKANKLLDVLASIDIFADFPIARAREFINIVREEFFPRGSLIVAKDTPGDKFFIIMSGNVVVEGMENENVENRSGKRYGTYEYFGEASLILDQPRGANVRAETDVSALTIDKIYFLNFIKGSDLHTRFKRLSEIRSTGSWELLEQSRFFRALTSAQKTQLELIMTRKTFAPGTVLIAEDERFENSYIIQSGDVRVEKGGRFLETLGPGDFVGEIFKLQKQTNATYTFTVATEARLYEIVRQDMIHYIARNPGVYMRLNYVYSAD